MPLNSSSAGRRLPSITTVVDARQLMAYAAGLGHGDSAYFDSTRPGGVVGHPMYPICPEWQLVTNPDQERHMGLTPAEAIRGVHARHDLHLHRRIPQDVEIAVSARIISVVSTSAGGLVTTRLDGSDDRGSLWTTWMGTLYRGVAVEGDDSIIESAPAAPDSAIGADAVSASVDVPVWAPHVYSECSRIWNPIHTDHAIALAAGLPSVILHGSAILAHGVDHVLAELQRTPDDVRRIGASFRDTVIVPSQIRPTVTAVDHAPDGVVVAHFQVLNRHGSAAVRDGFVVLAA